MLEQRDRISGNILLYDYLLGKRAPVFLNRNLKQSFRVHEHLLQYGSTDNYPGSDNIRSKWQPPSQNLLDMMISRERVAGSFVLEVHSIRRPGTPRPDHDPAQKVSTLMRIVGSTIRVSIIPSSSEIHSASAPAQEAVLRGTNQYADRPTTVDTDRIVIRPDQLRADPKEITDDETYRMMLSVNLASPRVAGELYEYMGLDKETASTYLSTSYANILECPRGKILLPLKAATKPLGLSLEVSMYWNDHAGGSVLANYNRHLTKTVPQPRPYPRPLLAPEPKYRLTWVYETESLARSVLVCLHCSKRRASANIEDLRMHLNSWHDYFKYVVTQEGVDEHGVEQWRFKSELADHKADHRPRASEHADEPFDVRVRAPARPFDRRKFLSGDDEFQRTARIEKPSRHVKAKVTAEVPTIAHVRRQQKPPDQVEPRPRRKKKTYTVPRAPSGITFFRSSSKRPLRQGEAISESDDELDEGWMDLRKHTEIDKERLSRAATKFINIYDDFMHDERLHSNIHAGDAIVRFARDQTAQIWQEDLFDELLKKLDELLKDNIISKEVHDGVLEIVTAQKPDATEANDLSRRLAELDVQHEQTALGPAGHRANKGPPPKKDRKGKGKAVVTETGHLTPITADSDGDVDMRKTSLNESQDSPDTRTDKDEDLPYDLCYCGEDASATPGSSGIIACCSIVSLLDDYLIDNKQQTNPSISTVSAATSTYCVCNDI
jgi:hypothetical protein